MGIAYGITYYIVLLLAGLGVSLWIVPSRAALIRILGVAPVIGLVQTLVIGMLCFYIGVAQSAAIPLAILLSVIAAWTAQGAFVNEPLHGNNLSWMEFSEHIIKNIGFASLCLTVVALPNLIRFDAVFPIRYNVDSVLYLSTAQFFMENGTVNTPSSPLVGAALFQHYRFGVSLFLAQSESLLGAFSAWEYSYFLVALSVVLAAQVVYTICRVFLALSNTESYILALLLSVNANALQLVVEGQWANAMFLPFLLLLVFGFLCQARGQGTAYYSDVFSISFRKSLIIGSLAVAGIASVYSEVLPLIFFVFFSAVGVRALTLYLGRIHKPGIATSSTAALFLSDSEPHILYRQFFYCFLSFIAGLMLIFPHSRRLAPHLIGLSTQVGYPLPHWASPAEIVGSWTLFHNHYSALSSIAGGAISIARGTRELLYVIAASVVICLTLLAGLIKARIKGSPLFELGFASLLAGLAAFVWFSLLAKGSTYTWFKATVSLLPIIWLTMGAAFFSCTKELTSISSKPWRLVLSRFTALGKFGAFLTLGLVAMTSAVYFLDLRLSSDFLFKSDLEIQKVLKSDSILAAYAFLPKPRGHFRMLDRYRDRIVDFQFACLLDPAIYIDQWEQINPEWLEKEVCFLVRKNEFRVPHIARDKVVYENESMIIIKAGVTLGDLRDQSGHMEYQKAWDLLLRLVVKK